jgi:1-acyl-sn-glycerol-3-phosphate acyltransferase
MNADPPADQPAPTTPAPRRGRGEPPAHDRSLGARVWYQTVRGVAAGFFSVYGGWRSSGFENMPKKGGVILVSNHASYLDVFLLGMGVRRPLNYVARSTLFVPGFGAFIRSVGSFPIQREGMGASGMKETLKRLRAGGVVTLFPEGTRSPDGELGELKRGIALLVARAGVPVVPAGVAGTFEAWPRGQRLPRPRATRVHYGPPILPADLEGLDPDAVTALIRERIAECVAIARQELSR